MKTSNELAKWKIFLLYITVSLFLIFEMAVQVSPSVMSTQLMQDLHLSTFGLGMMSGVYFYTYTAMQIPSGLLFDRYNPRIIITVSIMTCVMGMLLFALAQDIYIGCLARLLMGFGSAFAFVSVLVVTADLFKAKHFATMTGITQMLAALGAITGQMPISSLMSLMGWRNTLLVLCAIGLVLAAFVWNLLKYKRETEVAQISQENIRANLKKIIADKQTWYVAIYACLLWAPMSSFASLWGVPYLTNVYHFSEAGSAFLCSFMWLGLALGSPLLGMISTGLKNRVFPLAMAALIGAITFGLVLEFNVSFNWVGVLLFLAGAACSGQALSFTVVKENNSHAVKATAIAFNNMAVVISGALFQPLIGKIIDVCEPGNCHVTDFKTGLLVVLFSYVIAFVVAICFIREPRADLERKHVFAGVSAA